MRRRLDSARCLRQPATPDEIFSQAPIRSLLDIQRIIQKRSSLGIGICQRAYILHGGKVIAQGPSREILENPEVRRVYLGEHFQL